MGQKRKPPRPLTRDEEKRLKELLAHLDFSEVRRLLLEAHLKAYGSKAAVARSLGVCEKTIYNWLNQGKEPKKVDDARSSSVASGELTSEVKQSELT